MVVSCKSGVVVEVEVEDAGGAGDLLSELVALGALGALGALVPGVGGVWVDEEVVGGLFDSASFLIFSLKQTEQSPSLSVVLKNPQPLLQSDGNAC